VVHARQHLLEKLQSFGGQVEKEQAGDVRARPGQAGDELERNWVEVDAHNEDGDCLRCFLGCSRRVIGGRNDDVDVETDQFGREAGEPIRPPLGVPVLDDHVLAVDVAQLAQPLLKGLEERCGARISPRQISDPVHPGLLPDGHERRGKHGDARRLEESSAIDGSRVLAHCAGGMVLHEQGCVNPA